MTVQNRERTTKDHAWFWLPWSSQILLIIVLAWWVQIRPPIFRQEHREELKEYSGVKELEELSKDRWTETDMRFWVEEFSRANNLFHVEPKGKSIDGSSE